MRAPTDRKWTVLVLLFLALARPDAPGQETDTPAKSSLMRFLEQDYMLGRWGGGRPWLSEHGVDFEFFYIGSLPSVVAGGRRIETVYQGLLLMTLDLDSKKLAGYEGGRFHAGSLWLHGEKPFSDAFIGDLNKVNLIDYANAFRLWELYYEQRFFENKLSVKLGQLAVDQDFIYPTVSDRVFANQTFFFPTIAFNVFDIAGFPVGHHALPSSPLATPGVRVRWDPTSQCYVQAAVYDGNPDTSDTGTRINLNNEEGAMAYFETGYKLNQGKDASGLPGVYKIGGYYHTDDFVDYHNVLVGSGAATHSGNYGLYATADQTLHLEGDSSDAAKQGLGAFMRGGWAPEDRNIVEWSLDGGLVYRGLLPTRDWDAFGASIAWMWMSRDLASGQRFVNSLAPGTFSPVDYEGLVEVTYKAQLTAWWTLQPSLQWVVHPGGSRADRDALAFVLFTTLRF